MVTIGAAAAGRPQVLPAGVVAPEIVLVRIRAQRVEPGRQVPYVKEPGDTITEGLHRYVRRHGKLIGALTGAEGKTLFTCDVLHGEPLDGVWAAQPTSYQIVSPDDPRFATGVSRFGKRYGLLPIAGDEIGIHRFPFETTPSVSLTNRFSL